jgi:nitrate reductase NapA
MISFEDFKARWSPTPWTSSPKWPRAIRTSRLDLQGQAATTGRLYIDPKRKVVSFWTMGFNQHQRGTWVNEQAT